MRKLLFILFLLPLVSLGQVVLPNYGFNRAFPFPVDASSVWTNQSELNAYLALDPPIAYPGQTIVLVLEGEPTFYMLDGVLDLVEVSAEGNGFPLTNSVSAAWFDISDVGTLTASNLVGDGSSVSDVDAVTLGGTALSDIVLRDGSQSVTGTLTATAFSGDGSLVTGVDAETLDGVDITGIVLRDGSQSVTGTLTALSFSGGGSNVFTENAITVTDTAIGSYSDGMTISTGTSFETILRNILTTRVPASYTAPTFSLSASPTPTAYEVGFTPSTPNNSVILTPGWQQQEAGSVTNYTVRRNSTTLASFDNTTPVAYSDTNIVFNQGTTTYTYTVYYAAGPTNKLDNLGNPSFENAIPAGSRSASVTYNIRRRYWAGPDYSSASLLTNATQVKALGTTALIGGSSTFTVSATSGVKKVTFAYPFDRGELTSALSSQPIAGTSVLNEFKDNLVTNIFVGGINDHDPVQYRVYHWVPEIPPNQSIVFTLTVP